MPALYEEFIPIVATGTPFGICTIESKESIPSWKLLRKGIPITGIVVREAIIPGRWAEPFPAAITTSTPLDSICSINLSVFLGDL